MDLTSPHTPATELLQRALRLSRDPTASTQCGATATIVALSAALAAGSVGADSVQALLGIVSQSDAGTGATAFPLLQLFCLGAFEIRLSGVTVRFPGKAPSKSLALLKALVAFGGTNVPAERLVEALWPNDDEGAGHAALRTALHRLRRLVGRECIEVRDRKITLDREKCWSDVWAFEALMRQAESLRRTSGVEACDRALSGALQLYKAHFLTGDTDAHWSITMRERLRLQFLRQLVAHARRLEERSAQREALGWYQRGMELEPLAEELYQGAMRCYAALGLESQAVETYHRCKRALLIGLAIKPSHATEALYRSIRT